MADACQSAMRWACVFTHPQAERWAQRNLERAGYPTWLPLVPVRRRDRVLRTMWHHVELPAFARYVFVGHEPGSPWTPLRYAIGVASLLMSGNRVLYAQEDEISALQATLAQEGSQHASRPQWAPGDAVRLAEGPLRGTEAIVASRQGHFIRLHLMLGTGLATILVTENYVNPRD